MQSSRAKSGAGRRKQPLWIALPVLLLVLLLDRSPWLSANQGFGMTVATPAGDHEVGTQIASHARDARLSSALTEDTTALFNSRQTAEPVAPGQLETPPGNNFASEEKSHRTLEQAPNPRNPEHSEAVLKGNSEPSQQLAGVFTAKPAEANVAPSEAGSNPARVLALTIEGQKPLAVGFRKRVEIAVSGATAAYSLDPYVAEAGASNGLVQIFGKTPGSTNVVVVTPAGIQTLLVTVPQPAPNLPPGFETAPFAAPGESGIYELRYNSDPGQITNSLEIRKAQGQAFDRLQIVNANLLSAGASTPAVGFPLLAYEISRPRRDYTFLDQMVSNSPLTVDGYLVRGMHIREGDWQFHGGFTSVATFQGLFLATDREYVAGLSRNVQLDSRNSLQANAYYFRNPTQQFAANGAIGSIAYRYDLKDRAHLVSEAAFGHGAAFAMRGSFDDERDHLTASLRLTSPHFASLAVDTQRGFFADVNATRKLSDRLYGSFTFNQSDFNTPIIRQNTFTSGSLLTEKLNRNFSVNGGANIARFSATLPPSPTLTSVTLPAGIDFSTRHFGTGFEYQRVITSGGSGGNDYNVNARGSFGQFHSSAFVRHDVQVPTVAAIFSQIPGLQDALLRAGIAASTPDELAALLHNTVLLESLGFVAPLAVNLAPVRNDEGAGITWISAGKRHQQVDASYFNSDSRLIQGRLALSTLTLSYSQRLTVNDTIVGSASLVRTVSNGTTEKRPLLSVSLQHRFYNVPGLLLPGRHGVIEGHVFRDDESTGLYSNEAALAGVEVRLDNERVTHSDARGFYSFHHVPYGIHRVEARINSDEPFFFTTGSPVETDINSTVNFGINYAKGRLFGLVLNDARAPVQGVIVELQGANITRRVQTGDNGKFSFPGLPAGSYTVSTIAESYPEGYSLQSLEPQQAVVSPGKPASVQFTAKALRSISGKVLAYDKALLRPVPLAGAKVRLRGLSFETTTAGNGAYLFRNLPAGIYVVSVVYQGKETVRAVTVPEEPASLRDIDLNVGSKE
jgi:carboxypeptidase family protein